MTPLLAIAHNTFREAARNRVFAVLIFFALGMLALTLALSSASLNEEVRVMTDVGLFLISTLSVLIAVFTGVNLVYKELERKTIYTVVPKPVYRFEFLLGKFLGLAVTLALLVVFMTAVLMGLLALAGADVGVEMIQAGWLMYMEVLIVTAVALVFSSFSTPFLSGLLTVGVFLVGRFVDVLADLHIGPADERTPTTETLSAVVRAIAQVAPDLSLYEAAPHVVYGEPLTADYLLHATGLGFTYIGIGLLLAAVLFARRDFT